MTDLNELKQMQRYRDKVYKFLEEHRHTDDNKDKPTHVAYGSITGKFYMDSEQREDFMKLYIKALDNNVNDMPILEAQNEYGPIIIDIDLEQPIEDYKGGRLYNEKLIHDLIQIYVKAIDNYLIIKKNDYRICVFEKSKPQEKESTFRDGFHIMFPQLCVQTKIRHLIRYMAVRLCKEAELFASFTQPAEKIIDKSVVSSNNWFLYGSKKPNGHVYKLKKIYNNNIDIIYDHEKGIMYCHDTGAHINCTYDNEKLVKYFSLYSKKFQKKKATEMNDHISDSDIEVECNEHGINTHIKNEENKYEMSGNKEDEIRKSWKYTGMLSEKRAEDYHDWVRVGLVLHNIDNSLLSAWIDFSKKCSKKFKDGECEKAWRTMKNPSTGNLLTIRSLAFWAKQDDPKQYEAFNKEEFKNIMNKSLSGNTYFLAKSIHAKYSDRYICSSIKNNIWWEFRNHKWIRIDEGYTLKMHLSEDFANEYNKEISEISIMITKTTGINREELIRRRSSLESIVEKLMNNTFKKTLMDECKALFYDDLFDKKLDENTNLIGFENGVYDLEQNIFREGRPDDYITLSTKNYYQKWNDKNPYKNKILEFLSKILPNDRVRKYFIHALCTCLCGDNKEEKLYILTGCGSNGKSLTMDLMYHALGDYYMSCPITIITRKRGTSNETSPEKVRMKGKRCGVFQETDDGEKLNVGVMKEFTGGDKVLVRDLFKGSNEMIEFKPQMKFFLTCNQLPAVPSNDDGTWRRLRIIDFNSKFTDKPIKSNEFMIDNTLKQKIPEWGPAFLSYLLHIYNSEYKNMTYLADPDEVMASTKQYKMENDFYTEYVADRLVLTNNEKDCIKLAPLWVDFSSWYGLNKGNNKLPKKIDFIKFLNKQFNEPCRKGYMKIVFNNMKDESSDNEPINNTK
jgi:P4 family phage/plasmid primase-like protien